MSPEAPPEPTRSSPHRAGAHDAGRRMEDLKVMSFFEHLDELRSTLMWVLIVAGVASTGAWFVSQPVLDALVSPSLDRVYFSSPSEGFMIRVKVSVVIGVLVALPLVLGRIWGFVAPGLFRHERRSVVPVLLAGSLLFYAGIVFAWFVVVPRTVEFFLSFAGERLSPLLNVTQYFGFVAKFCLAFGLAFQLPLVIVMLSALGLVTPQRLWSQWRYGVIGIFVVAAWLTPPDAVSQCMMGIPLVALYLISLLLSFVVARRRRKRQRTD